MKKDIPVHAVSQVGIAIVPDTDGIWEVYLINMKDQILRHVLVNSRGYGEIKGEKTETSTLRYYFDNIAKETAMKVELIQSDLLQLANEYWISFSIGEYMYDKKFVFVQGSIAEDYFTYIPLLDRKGVLII